MEFIDYLKKNRRYLSLKEIALGCEASRPLIQRRVIWYTKPSIDRLESKVFFYMGKRHLTKYRLKR